MPQHHYEQIDNSVSSCSQSSTTELCKESNKLLYVQCFEDAYSGNNVPVKSKGASKPSNSTTDNHDFLLMMHTLSNIATWYTSIAVHSRGDVTKQPEMASSKPQDLAVIQCFQTRFCETQPRENTMTKRRRTMLPTQHPVLYIQRNNRCSSNSGFSSNQEFGHLTN